MAIYSNQINRWIKKQLILNSAYQNDEIMNEEKKTKEQSRWVDNDDQEVVEVFGFNKNAELVNSRAAMIGFLLLILTELIFNGKPATLAIFGIN